MPKTVNNFARLVMNWVPSNVKVRGWPQRTAARVMA